MVHVPIAFAAVPANLRLLEEVLYDLPPLEGVFLHWHTHGVTATTAGMVSLLARRKQMLGQTTLSGASIQLLYECAADSLRDLPMRGPHSLWDNRPLHARLLRHEPRLHAAQAQELLPPGVLVQKTEWMMLANSPLLCTGVGMQCLRRQHRRAIAAALAPLGRSAPPASHRLVEAFDVHPGMISPFLPPSRGAGLTALVRLAWPERWEAQGREVAIPLSLWESLVLPVRCLRQLVLSYAGRAYPGVQVIELESEETADAHGDKIAL